MRLNKHEFFKAATNCLQKAQKERPQKSIGDGPCQKKTRSILKAQVEHIEVFAKTENISCEEALNMTVAECNCLWKPD